MKHADTKSFHLLKRIFDIAKKYWPALLIGLIANLLYSAIDTAFTYLLKPLLDKGFVSPDKAFIQWIPIIVLVLFIARGIMNFLSNYGMTWCASNVVKEFRERIFSHFHRLPAKVFDHASTGQLLAKLLYDVDQVSNASADAIVTVVQSGALVLGMLFLMFSISWQLSLLYLISAPIISIIMRLSSKRLRLVNLRLQKRIGELTNIAEENIEGYKVVRMYNGQNFEIKRFTKACLECLAQDIKTVAAKELSVSSVQFVAAILIALTIYMATSANATKILSAGDFVALIAAMLALLKPLKDLTKMNVYIQRGLAGAQSVFEFLDIEEEHDNGQKPIARAQGKFIFSNLSFAYMQDKAVLENVSFSIEPGEMVALVGRSGSGKSTLVNLISRFYSGYTGHILLDDNEINEYIIDDYRRQFALVSQQVVLFNDTIANNIAYAIPHATEADIIQAAKMAHAWEFIETLPEKLNTMIGENGVLLSGGQRQRIAIARAILKNAPILILDEATSALDSESERYIQESLDELMLHRTSIVIAHRLSTIEKADKIVVMDKGKVLEIGDHKTLLAQNGHYANLYRMQFRDA